MLRVVIPFIAVLLSIAPSISAAAEPDAATGWQTPPEEVMKVLHAPQLPWVWTSPTGENLLLADPVDYPPLAELAGPMHKLAGIRVDPSVGNIHGRHGATSPRLVKVEGGAETVLPLPENFEVLDVAWTADGTRFALTVRESDQMGLWVGCLEGHLKKIRECGPQPTAGRPGALDAGPEASPGPPRARPRSAARAAGHSRRARDPGGQGRHEPLHLRVAQPARDRLRRRALLLLRHLRAGGGGAGGRHLHDPRQARSLRHRRFLARR